MKKALAGRRLINDNEITAGVEEFLGTQEIEFFSYTIYKGTEKRWSKRVKKSKHPKLCFVYFLRKAFYF